MMASVGLLIDHKKDMQAFNYPAILRSNQYNQSNSNDETPKRDIYQEKNPGAGYAALRDRHLRVGTDNRNNG